MNFFSTHYWGRIALFDLAGTTLEILPLEKAWADECLGGAALNRLLHERFVDDDPVVFGTGPLTGSFAPASCLLVATFRSPLTGRIASVPLTMRTGPQLKFAGFDFLVLTKQASDAVVLSLGAGTVSLRTADPASHRTVGETLALARRQLDYPESWIIAGPPAGSAATAAVCRGGSFDKAGLSAALAEKRVRGIFLNGSDGLPFGTGDLRRSDLVIESIRSDLGKKDRGFSALLGRFASPDISRLVPRKKGRNAACYRCPVPCMTRVPLSPAAGQDSPKGGGLFLADHLGFAALAGQAGPAAYRLMAACTDNGINPLAVADWMAGGASEEQVFTRIEALSRGGDDGDPAAEIGDPGFYGPLSAAERDFFGQGLPPLFDAGDAESVTAWKRRTARAMILGVCPILAARFPLLDSAYPALLADNPDQAKAVEHMLADCAERVMAPPG